MVTVAIVGAYRPNHDAVSRALKRHELEVRFDDDLGCVREHLRGPGADAVVIGATSSDTTGSLPPLRSEDPFLPVVVLAAGASITEIDRWFQLGATDVATTDLDPDELAVRLKALIRSSEVARGLRHQNEELRHFASTVAHDLKGPLSTVKGAADLLRVRWGQLTDDHRTTHLNSIGTAALRAADMISALLRLAMIDATPAQVDDDGTDARAAAESAIGGLALEPGDRVTVGGHWAQVAIPRPHLDAVLTNLVTNAHHYGRGPDGSLRLRVTGAVHPTVAVIEISDRGPGIADADRQRIFDPFYRPAGSVSVNPASTGIGLAIVRRLVERWGGSVDIAPRRPGTTFTVEIPLAQSVEELRARRPARAAQAR